MLSPENSDIFISNCTMKLLCVPEVTRTPPCTSVIRRRYSPSYDYIAEGVCVNLHITAAKLRSHCLRSRAKTKSPKFNFNLEPPKKPYDCPQLMDIALFSPSSLFAADDDSSSGNTYVFLVSAYDPTRLNMPLHSELVIVTVFIY